MRFSLFTFASISILYLKFIPFCIKDVKDWRFFFFLSVVLLCIYMLHRSDSLGSFYFRFLVLLCGDNFDSNLFS